MAGVVAALALAACATPHGGPLAGWQGVEQAALEACREPVHARLCSAPDAGEGCWDGVVERYDALRDVVARKRFLIEAGCPSPLVDAWLPDPR